mgnify:CR=1 FL=1
MPQVLVRMPKLCQSWTRAGFNVIQRIPIFVSLLTLTAAIDDRLNRKDPP